MRETPEISEKLLQLKNITSFEELLRFFRKLEPSEFRDIYMPRIAGGSYPWNSLVENWEALEKEAESGDLGAIRLQLMAWKYLPEDLKKGLQEQRDLLDAYTDSYFVRRLQWQMLTHDVAFIIPDTDNPSSKPAVYYHRVMQRLELIVMHHYRELADGENSLASLMEFYFLIQDVEKNDTEITRFRNYLRREYSGLCEKYFNMPALPLMNLENQAVPARFNWDKVEVSKVDQIRLGMIAHLAEIVNISGDDYEYPMIRDNEFLVEFYRTIAREIRLRHRMADSEGKAETEAMMNILITNLKNQLRRLFYKDATFADAVLCYIHVYLGDDFGLQFDLPAIWEKVLELEYNKWVDSSTERELALASINKLLADERFSKKLNVVESERMYYQRQLFLLNGNPDKASPQGLVPNDKMSMEMWFQAALHKFEKHSLRSPDRTFARDNTFTEMVEKYPQKIIECVLLELQKLMARNGKATIARVSIIKLDGTAFKDNLHRACENKTKFRDNGQHTFKVLRMILQTYLINIEYRKIVRCQSEATYQHLNKILCISFPREAESLKAEAQSPLQDEARRSSSDAWSWKKFPSLVTNIWAPRKDDDNENRGQPDEGTRLVQMSSGKNHNYS